MKQEVNKQLKVEEKTQEFLYKYEKENFVAFARKISNAHKRQINAFSKTLDRHQIGNAYEDGQIQYVVLKNEDTDTKVARFYERNDKKFILEDGCYELVDNFVRVGACEYFYPDGQRAGVEIYQGEDKPIDAIYFDPKGSQTCREMFDIHFRREHELDRTIEYAPRIKEYNSLVNDLAQEYLFSTNKIDAKMLHELVLGGTPKAYKDMLANDVETKCHDIVEKINLPEGFVEANNLSYIYGHEVPTKNYCFEDSMLRDIGITGNGRTMIPLTHKGVAIEKVIFPSYIPFQASTYHIVFKDESDNMICQQLVRNEEIHYQDIYYKDGTPCIIQSGKNDYDPESYDCNGRICNYDKAIRSLKADWGFEQQAIEMKYVSEGNPVRIMNSYETGFDQHILLVEVDGKKIPSKEWDSPVLPKGEHNIRIHLNTEKKILVPEGLFDGCDKLKSAKVVGIDKSLIDIQSKHLLKSTKHINKRTQLSRKTGISF